jgi:hypothetical protein
LNTKLRYLTSASVAATVTAVIMLVAFLSFAPPHTVYVQVASQGKSPLESGEVQAWLISPNGTLIQYSDTHNTLLTSGSTWIKNFLSSGTSGATNATNDISLGTNAAPTVGETKLSSEYTNTGLARASNTSQSINSTAYYVVYTWSATGTFTINATCLSYSSQPNGPTGVCMANVATATGASGDSYKQKWTVNVPSG